ncbi:hypothetical protein BGZ68_000548 [Mortierella alpina]|nr:hypothetical protein BGZ68_000548 [Mortierella alpina]
MSGQTGPRFHTYFCLVGFLLLTVISHTDQIFARQGKCLGFATAQNIPFFRKPGPDPVAVADEQVVANLKALSSSDSETSANEKSQGGTKKKQMRLSKGKGFEDLPSNTVADGAATPDTKESEGKKKKTKKEKKNKTKKKKDSTRHADDIIHEHDHADNDAYDDIVWYDGPHRDDEDEHGHDDEHGYEHGYEHDYDDHIDVQEDDFHHHEHEDEEMEQAGRDGVPTRAQHPIEIKPEVLANLKNIGGVKPRFSEVKAGSESESDAERSGAGSGSPATAQGSLPFTQQYINNNHKHKGGADVFHHSGADILEGTISPQEFCLRLKHECESTCREFRSQIVHLPTTCADGSIADLLLWGTCCQKGQVHRTHMLATTRQAELAEQHVRWQQKRHLAQQELDQQNPH